MMKKAAHGSNENGLPRNGMLQANYTTRSKNEQLIVSTVLFPLFNSTKDTETKCFLSVNALIELIKSPSIGAKKDAKLITPFHSNMKKKEHAETSKYHAIVIDHDHDNLSCENITAIYDDYGINYLAFTTSSHMRPDKKGEVGKRWKVVIPMSNGITAEQYLPIARGIALHFKSDLSQANIQQGFYAPNKLTDDAQYEHIIQMNKEWLDPHCDIEPFIIYATTAFEQQQRTQAEQAKNALVKQKGDYQGNDIIGMVNASYDVTRILEANDYKRKGNKYLSPLSSSGSAGVHVFNNETVFSHHSESDPLSALNHNGHSLDAFNLLCIFNHDGDMKKAVAHFANELDPDGQKQRQIQHMENKNAVVIDEFDLPEEIEEQTFTPVLPDHPEELCNLPNMLGELQSYIYGRMTYPCKATAGMTAFATMTTFAQTNITIDSREGLGFNEWFMVLAPTGFGKEDLRRPVDQLLTLAHAKTADILPPFDLVYSAPASAQGLHQKLEQNRSLLFLSDEFAEWLKDTKQGKKQEALGYFMQSYSKALTHIHPGDAVTTKYEVVNNARVSILATSTSEALFEAATKEQAESGTYNRWIMFIGQSELPQKRYTGLVYKPDEKLVNYMAWLLSQESTIKFSGEGFKTYIELDQKLAEKAKSKDPLLGGRLGEQAIKMAGLLALSDNRFVIEPKDITTAFKIRMGIYDRAKYLFNLNGNLDGSHVSSMAFKQLSDVFKKREIIYKSQFSKLSRAYQKLPLRDQGHVTDMLIKNGVATKVINNEKVLKSNLFKK